MSAFYGTPGDDVFRTLNSTLIIIPEAGIIFENSDVYLGDEGNDTFRIATSTFDLPDLLETSNDIFGGADNDTLIFAPPHDFPGQIDVTFFGNAGTDSAYLNFQPMGALDVDFTNFGPGTFTSILALTHADGSYAGQFFIEPDVEHVSVIGSNFADRMVGNAGDDQLDGKGGADTFFETTGNDTYIFDDTGDRVAIYSGPLLTLPDGGVDTIWTTVSVDLRDQGPVENLRLNGTADIDATGNDLANMITGNAGSNLIAGGAGNDSLYGKGGADTFRFDDMGAASKDFIWDFDSDDKISLGPAFAGLDVDNNGVVDAASFEIVNKWGAGGTKAGPELIYNSATGILSYDADGAGTTHAAQDIAFIGVNKTFFDNTDVLANSSLLV